LGAALFRRKLRNANYSPKAWFHNATSNAIYLEIGLSNNNTKRANYLE
jgi:hypothetical protein